jgi:hypothetical protein
MPVKAAFEHRRALPDLGPGRVELKYLGYMQESHRYAPSLPLINMIIYYYGMTEADVMKLRA